MKRYLLLTLIPGLLALTACKDMGLYCDEVTPCADRFPDKPFCDLHGSTAESEGIRNTCVSEEPLADAGTVDAPVTIDAGPDADLGPDAMTNGAVVVAQAGGGTGLVVSTPGGINCGSECEADFPLGQAVTLTATADDSSDFIGWSGGGCSGTAPCDVLPPASVTATFDLKPEDLTVTTSGDGTGNVTAVGISCGTDCTETYDYGTMVTLTAAPTGASSFGGWSGDGCTGLSPTCTVTMDRARAIGAAFDLNSFSLSVSLAGTGGGSVASSPGAISCPGTCSDSYSAGTMVTLTAAPDGTSTFTGWTGACTGANTTCNVTMSVARSVTATFARITHTLTVDTTGSGQGLVTSNPAGINCGSTCSNTYTTGTSVTLTQSASPGSTFIGWSGAGCSGTGTTCTVTMSQARSVTAQFCAPIDDAFSCTTASCDSQGNQVQTPNHALCSNNDVCDGAETCSTTAGCQSGTPLTCNNNDVCDGTETCSPTAGCQSGTPLTCSNNDVCDGTETCSPTAGCQSGTSLTCDDGLFCNGTETCSSTGGCQNGTSPSCTFGCNTSRDECNDCVPNSSVCTNGTTTVCGPTGLVSSTYPCDGPSCGGLSTTCGSAGNESCCAGALVPGGTYYRSYDAAADAYNSTSDPATVSDYWLDTYEITVGRFRKFVDAGMGTQAQPPVGGSGAHAQIAGSGWQAGWNSSLAGHTAALKAALKCQATWQTWTDAPGANEHRPITCITWYEAMAFCIWDGGYLPTEAEWNYAATGGDQQRAYPWSSPASSTTIDSTYAVYEGSGATANVGSKSPKGDGRWGHSDLAGSLWEWSLDGYDNYANPCNDCAGLAVTSTRAYRGGSFFEAAGYQRTGRRGSATPTSRSPNYGARCARTP